MASQSDTLALAASVVDNFSKPLADLTRQLKSFPSLGEKLAVNLDYQLGFGSQTGGGFVLPGQMMHDARVEIGSIDYFSHDQRIRITLATVTNVEGHQHIFQWGDAFYNNTKVGVTWGSYIGRIVLVSQDKSEEYYFIVVPRSFGGDPRPPIIIGPNLISSLLNWE